MLTIERIIETMPYGRSKPIKIKADNGKVYIVKFRSDGLAPKDRSITNEFIAYRLIEKLNWSIAPQPLEFILIDNMAIELAENANIDSQSLLFMRNSLGTNIAIPYLDNCEKVEGEIENRKFIEMVRTIDNIMLNDDRDIENPNILKDITRKSRYYAIDWGLSLDRSELYKDIKQGIINNSMMYYQTCCVVKRPEYLLRKFNMHTSLDPKQIEDIIDDIIEEFPKEWETHSAKSYIKQILIARALSKDIFN